MERDKSPEPEDSSDVADEESRLLESFLDGELSEDGVAEVRSMLAVSPRLRRELQLLQLLRTELSGAFNETTARSGQHLDLWSKIEPRLVQGVLEQRRGSYRLQEALAGVLDFFRAPGPSRGAFAATCAALVLIVASSTRGPATVAPKADSYATASSAGAAAAGSQYSAKENAPLRDLPLQNVSFGQEQQLAIPNLSAPYDCRSREVRPVDEPAGATRGFALSFSVRRPSSRSHTPTGGYVPFNEQNFLRSGMRTKGADIDFIRGAGPIRLLPTKDEKEPPVIWVANNKRTR